MARNGIEMLSMLSMLSVLSRLIMVSMVIVVSVVSISGIPCKGIHKGGPAAKPPEFGAKPVGLPTPGSGAARTAPLLKKIS